MKQCFMESSWSPLYFGQSLWTPCGVFIDSTWTPHGVHRDYWELVGNVVWSPHGVHVDSLWTPQSLLGLHGNRVLYTHPQVSMESTKSLHGLHEDSIDTTQR